MIHEKYFKFPLELDDYCHRIVWTKDYSRAFDFFIEDVESKKKIVDCLNGINNGMILNDLTYDDGTIFLDGSKLLMIRSWGRLIGTGGGLGLKTNKAIDIQDSFANWIIEKLTVKKSV